jgi:hypothetical protein
VPGAELARDGTTGSSTGIFVVVGLGLLVVLVMVTRACSNGDATPEEYDIVLASDKFMRPRRANRPSSRRCGANSRACYASGTPTLRNGISGMPSEGRS